VGGTSYGYLPDADGGTFNLTWEAAKMANVNVIQIQTWNDYGEGTIIEPTIEWGYRDLEFIQERRREMQPDFPFTQGDLRLPIELYRLLISSETNNQIEQTNQINETIAAIYDAIFAGDAEGMRALALGANVSFDYSVRPILLEPTGERVLAQGFDAQGRRNLAAGRPITASSHIDVWAAQNAVDGDLNTYWEGMAGAFPGVLTVELAEITNIQNVVIKLNPQRIWARRVQRIELQGSTDGTEWTVFTPAQDFVFCPIDNANTAVIQVNESAARFVRLIITANSGAANGQAAEFEVYGE
jgi:hypothetical protein